MNNSNIDSASGGSGDDNSDNSDASALDRFIDLLSGLFQPFLGALAATGIIKGLVALLGAFGMTADNGFYALLNVVGDGFFQFLPVALAITAAARFKLNQFVALAIVAAFLHPAIGDLAAGEPLYTLFSGTPFQSDVFYTFLGFPIILPPAGNYYSTVIPIILAIWFASKVDKWVKGWVPGVLAGTLVPLFTILISAPIAILIIGPIATWASSLVGSLFTALNDFSPILFGAILTGAWQILVIFGLHWGIVPLGILQLSEVGQSNIFSQVNLSTFAIFGILLAIAVRSREAKTKELATSSSIPALFGITEPAIYGLMLPMRKLFVLAIVINVILGAYTGFFEVTQYNLGGLGIFALPTFIHPTDGITMNFWHAVITYVAAPVLGFIGTMIMGVPRLEEGVEDPDRKDYITDEPQSSDNTNEATPQENIVSASQDIIGSPITGQAIPLEQINDEVFASGAMGKGIGFDPTEGVVYAPSNATVSTIFPTGHAIGLKTENETEILIHIGLDTVELDGEGFEPLVEQGDTVSAGQELIRFDINLIKDRGFSTETPVIVTNTNDFEDVILTNEVNIDHGDYLLTAVRNPRVNS